MGLAMSSNGILVCHEVDRLNGCKPLVHRGARARIRTHIMVTARAASNRTLLPRLSVTTIWRPVRHSSDRRADPRQVCHPARGIPPASSQRE